MRKVWYAAAASLAVALAAPAVHADEKKGGGYLYRYKNDKGVMVIDAAIPPEYSTKGYDIITRSGQLVQKVAPAVNLITDPEESKRVAEQNQAMGRRDAELRKLYSSPDDAVRLRDRQIEALNLKMDYLKGQASQLSTKRKTAVEQAARLERQGTPVPADMRQNIQSINVQMTDLDRQMKSLQAEKDKMIADFAPIIDRLKVIYHVQDPAPAAAPAAAAPAPAVKPAAAPAPAVKPAAAPAPAARKP